MYNPLSALGSSIALLTLLQMSSEIFAQEMAYKVIPPQYELEHIKLNFKTDPGLLNDIVEDKEGYLWLSSTAGLHVFDGHNTVTYKSGYKPFTLSPYPGGNAIRSICHASIGPLSIVEGHNRIIRFDLNKRSFIDSFTKKIESDGSFLSLPPNGDSRQFFIELNFKKNIISFFRRSETDVIKIYDLNIDINGNLYFYQVGNHHWLLHNGNLLRLSLDGKDIKKYPLPFSMTTNFIAYANSKSIYFTDSKQEVIYTWNEATDKVEFFLDVPSFIASGINTFYVEGDQVYIGNFNSLLIINKTENTIQNLSPQFTALVRKESPGSLGKPLNKFLRQKDGTLLLQTLTNIYRLKKKMPPVNRFRQLVEVDNTNSNLVSFRQLTEDANKNVYASYYTGISKKGIHGSLYRPLPVKQYMNGASVSTYSLHHWKGFLLWNNVKSEITTGKYRYMFGSTFSGHCTQHLQNDSLWLVKWGVKVLYCYDLKRDILNSYPLEVNPQPGGETGGVTEINDMIADKSGQNLWIATTGGGLALVTKKGKLLRQYMPKELSIPDDKINDLELTGETLWLGCAVGLGALNTRTGKINIYKNPVIINEQLTNRAIYSILKDSVGNFYLGSSRGLLYFDTKRTTYAYLNDGHPLSEIEFNRASAFRSSNDTYYLGTTDGLYAFTSGELQFFKSTNAIKPIKLYGISVYNNHENAPHYMSENLDSLKELVLKPGDNNIQFEFSIPEFYRNIYYSYRVKGLTDIWTDYKPDSKIFLNALQPNNYTLQLKASTSLSDENAVYFSLPIEMKQLWYKKTWVIVLFSMVIVSLLVGFLRHQFNQRIQRQKELANLRTKISSDLHDDVGTILAGLAMQSQLLTFSANKEQKETMTEMSRMSRDAMERMRDTVWAIDNRKDRYENLIDRMRVFAEKSLSAKNITHEFNISEMDTKKFINPEKRQNIYLIFKEAITNIVKHSDCKHVSIHFSVDKNKTMLTIHDDGTRKNESLSDGLGLSNMKMRAGKLGGYLSAKYENGFIVELRVS